MTTKHRLGAATGAVALASLALLTTASPVRAQNVVLPDQPTADGQATLLPNGWKVSPAGTPIGLPGDMPLSMVFSPDGKYLLVNTAGFHDQDLDVIDTSTQTLAHSVDVGTDWLGLCMVGNDVYLSGGGVSKERFAADAAGDGATVDQIAAFNAPVHHMTFSSTDGSLVSDPGIDLTGLEPKQRFVAGVAAGPDGALYVVNIKTNTVYKLAAADKSVVASSPVGGHPYAVAVSQDGKTVAVTSWSDDTVSLLSADSLAVQGTVKVGSRPDALAWGPDGRLFVTNSGSNSVSVIENGAVIETITTSLTPRAPTGSTPDALAVSPSGHALFVANADNNDIAVVDISDPKESRVVGFIPTGWYPSAIAVAPDGKTLYIGTAKGMRFYPNAGPNAPVVTSERRPRPTTPGANSQARAGQPPRRRNIYIGSLLSGTVSVVPVPTPDQLDKYTAQVKADTPTEKEVASDPAQITKNVFSKIKHIVYIIRENRTYDQVFGDIKDGNGDPNLVLFGQNITPNAHALAEHYVLLDNLYCNGEVSEDGHRWCDAAYETDYGTRVTAMSYSGRSKPDSDDEVEMPPSGFIWDDAARHGESYETYGEFSEYKAGADPNDPPTFVGGVKELVAHSNPAYGEIPWFTGIRDEGRAQVFIDDLHKGEQTGNWPALMVLGLPEDHTQGMAAGGFTPTANVAENDQGLGKIVDAVSHSKFWSSTAIFVVEDDAQAGPDHVDAHRTVGLVISPYVKRNYVDSTMYTQASMVRTIELILKLPPMTQYDAAATPMYNSFTPAGDMLAYNDLAPQVDVEAKNPETGPGAEASAKLDLSAPDRCDPLALNHILWAALKPGVPYPAPVRSAALVR